ncbi:hypothetical protein HOY34_06785 [Xinfangfangia sp. D13-10-4-6]|nr:hypothetical protein [Pseudogemmobacter hezensis]
MMQCFVDVTDLPAAAVTPGTEAEVFGTAPDLNHFAAGLGLKPNYLLTQIGGLCHRRYVTHLPGDC